VRGASVSDVLSYWEKTSNLIESVIEEKEKLLATIDRLETYIEEDRKEPLTPLGNFILEQKVDQLKTLESRKALLEKFSKSYPTGEELQDYIINYILPSHQVELVELDIRGQRRLNFKWDTTMLSSFTESTPEFLKDLMLVLLVGAFDFDLKVDRHDGPLF
jgi:hypothetical protein